jgi:hypothetical protein
MGSTGAPINDLNGAKRLNVWNALNGLIPVMNGAKRLNGLNDLNRRSCRLAALLHY